MNPTICILCICGHWHHHHRCFGPVLFVVVVLLSVLWCNGHVTLLFCSGLNLSWPKWWKDVFLSLSFLPNLWSVSVWISVPPPPSPTLPLLSSLPHYPRAPHPPPIPTFHLYLSSHLSAQILRHVPKWWNCWHIFLPSLFIYMKIIMLFIMNIFCE